MPKYVIKIQYDGTHYVGYQVQPNGLSVQEALEKAIRTMAKLPLEQNIPTSSAGRTDSGVHALGQVVSFNYPVEISPNALIRALNSILEDSIRVIDATKAQEDFHVRYHAIAKEYVYRVDISRFPDPFKRYYTTHHPYRFNLKRMQIAIKDIVGTHDFTSFCSTKTDKEDKVRTIYEANVYVDEQTQELVFNFYGNGFLYNMVRILVGTLLQIGDGLKPEDELAKLIEAKDRNQAGPTAPPQGLYMKRVVYNKDPFSNLEDTF